MFFNQRGAAHLLLIVAAIGLLGFLVISNSFSFKDKLFQTLFPKPQSSAASADIIFVDGSGNQITNTTSSSVLVKVTEPSWASPQSLNNEYFNLVKEARAQTLTPTNLIKNSGCDSNFSPWSKLNSIVSRSTIFRSGTGSCQATNIATVSGKLTNFGLDDKPDTVPLPALGKTYLASAWVRTDNAIGKNIGFILRAKGGVTSALKIIGPTIALSSTWQKISANITIDKPDRKNLEVQILLNKGAVENSFQADDIELTLAPVATPTPVPSPTPPPTPVTTQSVTFAEDANFTVNAQTFNFTTDPIPYAFSDQTPGTKSLYVKFRASDGREKNAQTFPATIELVPPAGSYDLDVLNIERTPRYNRYDVVYINRYPTLRAGTENEQRWPNPGESVTFTAHFKNQGPQNTGNFSYKWLIDGAEVKNGVHTFLGYGVKSKDSITWTWQEGDHTVEFLVDTNNSISDILRQNNQRKDFINALYLRLHIDQTVYNRFNNLTNVVGTKSFEDWVQAHLDKLNKKIADSGGKQTVRIDQILVEPDHVIDPGGTHAPLNLDADGSWGFVVPEWCRRPNETVDTTCNDPSLGIYTWAPQIQPGLVHEWTHQLGMAHSYDANIDIASDNGINGQRLIQRDPEIVGKYGADDVGYAFEPGNESLTPYFITALNSNLGFRRGYYADYLFDVPDNTTLQFKDDSGNILSNAQLEIWQSYNSKLSGNPRFTGTTDAEGLFVLPNQSLPGGNLTTATGHTLKPNPFGVIDVVGNNGLFLIRVTPSGSQSSIYEFITIHSFNLAYWKGSKTNAILPIVVERDPAQAVVTVPTGCSDTPYQVTISWGNINPPVSFVDISTSSTFDTFYNKPIPAGVTSTDAPPGFSGYQGVTGPLTLEPNKVYYARTFNGTHGPISNSFYVLSCTSVNVALNKPTSASSNSHLALRAVDGDKTSSTGYWEPFNAEGKIGDWVKVDLGANYTINKFTVYAYAGNGHDWYSKFRIEVSSTGAFAGEQQTVVTETNWDVARGTSDNNKVDYNISPVQGRYIRIISDVNQNYVKLHELEVFGSGQVQGVSTQNGILEKIKSYIDSIF